MVYIMKKDGLTVLTLLMLAACNTSAIPFERMTDLQLARYNVSVDFWQQVYCTSDIRIGSHIRKRTCATLQQLYDYNANQIGVLNTVAVGGSGFR